MHVRVAGTLGVWGAVVLLGMVAAACDTRAPTNGVGVRDSLGVTILEHPRLHGGADASLRLERSNAVLIGVTEGSEEYQFFGVIDAQRRRDGSIVVLDRSQTLRVYDSTGVHLWTSGGKGDGPGEFNWAQRIVGLPGDTLAVWDSGPGRLNLFTGSGDFVRSWTVPGVAGTALLLGAAQGNQLILEQRMIQRGAVGGHPALTVNSKLYWLDLTASRVEVVGQRRSSIQYQEVDENGAYSPAVFATAAVLAPAPEGFWYGDANAPELQRIARGRGVDAVLRWSGTRQAVQESDVEAVIEKWSSTPDATPELRRTLAEYARTHPRADWFPPYEELLTDPSGDLWLRDFVREHEDEGIRRWTVFSDDGRRMLGRLEHEASFRPLRVDLEGVLGVDRDGLGVERIAYRRVVR